MAQLSVNLVNGEGFRLTIHTTTPVRNIPHENAACARVEQEVNANPQHKELGPWKVQSSGFTSG
jgi:hypothetical protein